MGSSTPPPAPPADAFLHRFRLHAAADGRMSFADFMRLALYDPEVGYYRRPKIRVGYGPGTDFFTASTSGPVFGDLVAAAAAALLDGQAPGAFQFCEIGAEPGRELLASVTHPFKATHSIPLGTTIALHGPAVVFANELFDAQPFRRFVHRSGRWLELGVAWRDGALVEVALAQPPTVDFLPAAAPEGYLVDTPLAAVELLDAIAREPWHGVFIACDYGKTWTELAQHTPAGTARAYFRHTQSNDLLARPGEQDLTCHVCWDWLAAALRRHGFQSVEIETQEAFFVRHAGDWIAATVAREAGRLSPRKQALLQLLHPDHLGQKFQVLHARRAPAPR